MKQMARNISTNLIPYSGLFSRGKIFCEFHESSSIRENFTPEMFLFSEYSTQSVTICENFALEKLGKLNSRKFSPSKITHYTVTGL